MNEAIQLTMNGFIVWVISAISLAILWAIASFLFSKQMRIVAFMFSGVCLISWFVVPSVLFNGVITALTLLFVWAVREFEKYDGRDHDKRVWPIERDDYLC